MIITEYHEYIKTTPKQRANSSQTTTETQPDADRTPVSSDPTLPASLPF